MAGPALRLLDPRNELASPPEEELRRALDATEPQREHSIIVAAQDPQNLDALVSIAEPLARSEPPRELILLRPIVPTRYATGLAADDRELRQVNRELGARRAALVERGVDTRAVAFTTPDAGEDTVRLADGEAIDLVLLDGSRPLLGDGVPRGAVGEVLAEAASDVAVLVERAGGAIVLDADNPVVVPFGGAEHDWAALELGAWIASGRGAPLRLLGAAFSIEHGERDASRLLANASLVVQQLAHIDAEPVLVNPGEDVIRAARGAGLLVVGMSDNWREEGLGPLRSEIIKEAPAPTLLVRRGTRAGVLAGRENMTRFRWSRASV
jgi:hypothetical protein